jgi:hypothetical protein
MKTNVELNLTEKLYNGLVMLLGLLKDDKVPGCVRMDITFERSACGTEGCILGWGALLGGLKMNDSGSIEEEIVLSDDNDCTSALFMPYHWGHNLHTQPEILHALETYLYTGTPEWPCESEIYRRIYKLRGEANDNPIYRS